VPIIEAGIEDGMAHLNAHGTTNLSCDGWTNVGSLWITARAIGGGQDYYVTTISNFIVGSTNITPIIDSRGYVKMPVLVSSANPYIMMADMSGAAATQGVMARGIRVNTGRNALFSKGLVAKGQINLNGNNIATDSFDSTDPTYSGVNGAYDATKHKANGDIATNSGLTNSVNVGGADILGHISTGPGGSVSIGANGSVGDLTWASAGHSGAQPGSVKDDMNVNFPDSPTPPSGGTSMSSGGTVNGVTYDHVLGNGVYQEPSLSMSGNANILVTGTNVVLYVTGNVSLSGNAYIQLATGAKLTMYVGGTSTDIGGNGVLNSGFAANFYYYGLTNNTSINMHGNAAFTGVIYAPQADMTMGGGGNSTYDFVGAAIAKTVSMNGHYNFHYDEALNKYGPSKGFIVTSWNEMSPQEVRALAVH